MKAYQLGLYEKAMPALSWREKLSIAKQAGYDFVELSIDATEERIARVYSSMAERIELRRLTEELSMPFGTLNASALTRYSLGNEDAFLCSRGIEIAKRSIELAADLGIRVVMIPGYDVYYGVSTP
ncbi:MAG: TIM barrel protein, partial [Clostridia bacterium]|nr:TIM barrel protein [Clostridia bacterium]